jgi:hypothetical protein
LVGSAVITGESITTMNPKNITTTITVDQTPAEAFAAINNVQGWWSGNLEGGTDKLGDEFTYRYKDLHYSKQRITELVPGRKVAWLVLDSHLSFVKDKAEWNGTTITFEIKSKGKRTEIRFTHRGLIRSCECFGLCSDAWGFYIRDSLRNLIANAKGHPNPEEDGAVAATA